MSTTPPWLNHDTLGALALTLETEQRGELAGAALYIFRVHATHVYGVDLGKKARLGEAKSQAAAIRLALEAAGEMLALAGEVPSNPAAAASKALWDAINARSTALRPGMPVEEAQKLSAYAAVLTGVASAYAAMSGAVEALA